MVPLALVLNKYKFSIQTNMMHLLAPFSKTFEEKQELSIKSKALCVWLLNVISEKVKSAILGSILAQSLLSITAISLHVNNQKNLRHRFWEKKNIWHLSYFSHFPLISAESHLQKNQAKPHFQLIFWMLVLIWRKKTRVIFLRKAILGQAWTDGLICFYILTSSKARAQEEIAVWRKKKKKKKTAKRKKRTSPHPCFTLPDAKLLCHILNVLNLS